MGKSLVSTICPYCGAGCGLTVVVEGGRAVGLEYPVGHPVSQGSLCPKGNAALEILDHPERLTRPLIRQGTGFREASWDEALDLIAGRLSEVRATAGAGALGFLASAKCSNEENYLFQKLARLLGTNNVDHCARLCHAPTVVGLAQSLGSGAMTNPLSDLAWADCILIIGSNLAENHPPASRYVWQARDRGARVIVADPRLTPTTWMADLFLQIKPGSDVALLNGMMHVILAEGLHDREFVGRRTSGVNELSRAVATYSPERVSEITGVPAAQIVAAARLYAGAGRAVLAYCMGITQHTSGVDNVLACADLALLCGHVGRPGAGLMPLRGQNNVQGACDMGALAEFYPGYRPVVDEGARSAFARAWGVEAETLSFTPGMTVMEMMHAAADGDLQVLYVMGENPAVSDPDAGRVQGILGRLPFLVAQDIFMTETAQLADVVLPAAAWAEKEGSYTNTERRVQWSRQAVLPPGEAQPDWQILSRLAQRLSALGHRTAAEGTMPWLQYGGPADVLEEIGSLVPAYGGITASRLQQGHDGLQWPCPSPGHPGTPVLHQERFATDDGRARLVPVEWTARAEELAPAYPVTLTTGRVGLHYNAGSMTRRSQPLVDRLPALFVALNPADAGRLGLIEGDEVRVSTRRGVASARAHVTDTVEPGVAFMPFHFEGTNRLTLDALDPRAKIPEYKVAACHVGPAGGEG